MWGLMFWQPKGAAEPAPFPPLPLTSLHHHPGAIRAGQPALRRGGWARFAKQLVNQPFTAHLIRLPTCATLQAPSKPRTPPLNTKCAPESRKGNPQPSNPLRRRTKAHRKPETNPNKPQEKG
jgi:hypothetical protein